MKGNCIHCRRPVEVSSNEDRCPYCGNDTIIIIEDDEDE